jgi:hypothetical protein
MNRAQILTLIITALNLALILLFPPFDYQSIARGGVPTFEGFSFYFGHAANRTVNGSFLYLEVFVVLINGAIAWLLMRSRAAASRVRFDYQRIILVIVAVNLVLITLFPPFENASKITRAILPSFDGFYLVFGDNSARFIVMPILWLEVIFVLVNGALFWLLLKDRNRAQLSTEEIRRLSKELKRRK